MKKEHGEEHGLQAIHVREGDTPITGFEICGPRERGKNLSMIY